MNSAGWLYKIMIWKVITGWDSLKKIWLSKKQYVINSKKKHFTIYRGIHSYVKKGTILEVIRRDKRSGI